MPKRYDSVTILINMDMRSPFTASEAIEFLGDIIGFQSVYMPNYQSVRAQIARDCRVRRIGTRRNAALYEFLTKATETDRF